MLVSVIEGMRKRRAIMVRMERVWNTVAVGGVLGALLTTAGVVNLGNLPSWSSSASTPTRLLGGGSGTRGDARSHARKRHARASSSLCRNCRSSMQPSRRRRSAASPPRCVPRSPPPTARARPCALHDEIKATLLTTTDAYAYCYYADGAGSISRIFPNRFAPSSLVRTGALELTRAFSLVADKPNRTEEVRCIAATKDLGSKLPGELQAEDLVTPAG